MRRRILAAVAFLVVVSGLAATAPQAQGVTGTPAAPVITADPGQASGGSARCTAQARTYIATLARQAVTRRENVLERLDAAAGRASSLTAEHRRRVSDLTSASADGLGALPGTVASATDCTIAVTLARGMVTDYRVYALVAPQVRLAIAGDTGAAAAAGLTDVLPALKAAVAALSAGDPKIQAQSLLSEYSTQATVAAQAFGPVADAVLTLRPVDYPGNRATLTAQGKAAARGAQALTAAAQAADRLAALLAA